MKTRKYYIYAHKDGAETVYIGRGQAGRIYATNRTSLEHTTYIEGKQCLGDFSYAEFLHTGLTFGQSVTLEGELIRDTKPKYNIRLKGVPKRVYKNKRKYPHLSPEEAMGLGVVNARLSPNTGKRGKGKKTV
jgi:excinuclease UvrABC nuclease subunit